MELIVKKCKLGGAYEVNYPKRIDLNKLKGKFETVVSAPDLMIIKNKCECTICKNGKILIKGCDNQEEAQSEYESILRCIR